MKRLKLRAAASLAALAVLLAVTGVCVAIQRDRPRAMSAQSVLVAEERADPVTEFRLEREQLRQRQRAELNDIIHSADTDETTLGMAQRQLLALIEAEDSELKLEGLLKARGLEDVLATVGGDSVNVIVRKSALTRRETAVILDLVLRETGVTGGNVKIIPIN